MAQISTTSPGAAAPAAGQGEGADDGIVVRRELLALMLGQSGAALTAHAVLALAVMGVLNQFGVQRGLWVWLAALVALLVLRWAFAQRTAPVVVTLDRNALAAAERRLTLLVAASSGVWGLLPWLAYTEHDAFVNFFIVAVLIGLSAGVINAAAAVPSAMVAHLVAMLGPFVLLTASMGGLINGTACVTVLFMGGVLYSFSRNSHRTMRNALVLTRRNAQLAANLKREHDTLRATMHARELFLAGVTHDLRQPVHGLALHLRHLRRLRAEALSPEALEALCRPMDEALSAMSRQLTRLLELSRLEAGEVSVNRGAVDLTRVFAALAAQFGPQAAEKGLRIAWRLPPGLVVPSDARLLQSIVDNLVANAVRYTERGGVLVAARRRGADVQLQVFDTGRGMAPEVLPEIFVPYRRFDDRERAGDEGQGLGLALASKQAELLGHGLSVRSVPGRGSCFTLRMRTGAA